MHSVKILLFLAIVVCAGIAGYAEAGCPAGDLDGNCRVDLGDLLVLSEDWLSTADTAADLNSDGDVNAVDLSILAANWGRIGVPLVINEFLASNTKTYADPHGQFDDWIELYNAGDRPVDVGGMYLTDDLAAPTKWQVPSGNPSLTTINSKGYLLIWADNDVGQSGLHANFRIDAAGDEIALFDKDGSTLIDSISFGDQIADVSYGRYPDAADDWALMAFPTPGGMNILIYEGFVAKPQFSHQRDFYDQPFVVTFATETEGATIYYTVDGSTPYDFKLGVPRGAYYAGPIPITKTTCLRAVACKSKWQPSAVATHSYFFVSDVKTQSPSGQAPGPGWPTGSVNSQMINYGMDPDVVNNPLYKDLIDDALLDIPTISLVTDLANLFSASTGIYVNARSQGRAWERPVSVELINPPDVWRVNPDGSDGFQIDAGLRIRGGYSRSGNNPKHAFRLFFRPDYGASKLRFALFGDEGVDEFECVDLRCSQNYSWSFEGNSSNSHDTFVREVFSRDTQRDMGQPYTRSRYYHLYIDGHYWGLYQTQERSEASYAESYFGGDKEDYDVVKSRAGNGGYDIEATDGTLDAWRRLWDSLRTTLTDQTYYRLQGLNTDGTPNPAYEKLLDVDNLIDYMLCTYYVGDPDGPVSAWARVANNFYGIYNRNNPDGFKFFRHDAEHSLWDLQESRLFASTTLAVGSQFNQSNPLWVHTHLIVHPEYKMRFADRVYKYFFNDGVLTPGRCTSRFMDRANQINLAIIAESARWGDAKRSTPRTRDADWLPDINRIVSNYLPYRTGVVLNQFKSQGWFPNVDAPTFNQQGGYIPSGFNLQLSAATGKIYYTLDGSDPRLPEHASGGGATTTLVAENAAKRVLVPTAAVNDAWKGGQTFDDSSWTAGTGGVGYETSSGYQAYFSINVRDQMYNKNTTCYIRIPFTVSSAQLATSKRLTLRMRYDDGFVAYINGTEVKRNLFTAAPSWNSQADSTHDDSAAVIFEDFDISNYVGLLHQGENLLAVHGLNRPANSTDFLISVELVGVDSSTSGGGVSPAAIEYTKPIMLAKSAHVKARVLSGATWSALNEAVFAVGPVAESLRITEIMYHPQDTGSPSDPNTEFVELKNVGTETINLNLARFTKGIDFSFGDVSFAPNKYILVVKDLNAFNEKYGQGLPIAGSYTGSLDNAGERIRLQDAAGRLIHDFKYSDGWYDITDGVGFSLTVKDPANLAAEPNALDDKSIWRPSASIGGSPGYDDTGEVPELGDIVINEILAHSHAAGADWIELHNTTNTTINIGNWFLSDDGGNLTKYQIEEGTSIPAYGYIVFYEHEHFNNLNDPGCNVPFALSENGETLYLHSGASAGVLTGYSEQEKFDASETGVSMGRYKKSTGAYNFVALQTPTPGADNSYPKVGPVVINEIMYHPDTVNDAEYVELLNISGSSVTLYDELVGEPWRFVDDPDNPGVDFRLPTDDPVVIGSGEYLLLVKDLTLFSSKFTVPQGVKIFEWGPGRLDNGGEKIQISKPGDVDLQGVWHWIRVDRVVYSDGAHPDVEPNSVDPWPKDADGLGKSLSRKYPYYYGNDPNNWQASVPTPGQPNQ